MAAAEPIPGSFLPSNPAGPVTLVVEAAAVLDGVGTMAAPGAVLLRVAPTESRDPAVPRGCWRGRARVLAAGTPAEVASHPEATGATRAGLPDSAVIPGLVNAHTHLDLTSIGPREYEAAGGFAGWVQMVRALRPIDGADIRAAVRRGAKSSLAGGVVAVGDIAGAPRGRASLEAWRALRETPLVGVSFLEFFAIGAGERRGRESAEDVLRGAEDGAGSGVRLGLQPHAPNTVALDVYLWAVEQARSRGLPLATHLAETIDEREFVACGSGPQRTLLEAIGLWDDSVGRSMGRGLTPVQHLKPALERARFLLAHVNDANDDDLAILAATGQSVAYCPRASAYFGNPRRVGPHRYREMLSRGVNVALGTDSIINLPRPMGAPGEEAMGVLEEMRLLYSRDATDAVELLRMGTINGARALGLSEEAFTLRSGALVAGLVAIRLRSGWSSARSAIASVLSSEEPARLIVLGN